MKSKEAPYETVVKLLAHQNLSTMRYSYLWVGKTQLQTSISFYLINVTLK